MTMTQSSVTIRVDDDFDSSLLQSERPGFTGMRIKMKHLKDLFKLPEDAVIDASQIDVDITGDALWLSLAKTKAMPSSQSK